MKTDFNPLQPEWSQNLSCMMTRQPSAFFQQSIAFAYQFQTKATSDPTVILPGIPDGCLDIIFNLNGDTKDCFLIPSPKVRKPFVFNSNTPYMGIRLLPLQSIFTFDLSLVEINQYTQLPLFEIFPGLLPLYDQLINTTSLDEQLQYVEAFLLQNKSFAMSHSNTIDSCIHYALHSKGNIYVKDLESLTLYSERYLRKLFQKEIGISPKHLIEIIYFQYTIQEMLHGDFQVDKHLSDHDLYDTSHFYKKFKKFTNMTPIEYQKILQM